MFKKLTDAIRTWFREPSGQVVLTRDDLYAMYRRVHDVVRKAETLMEMLEAREQIRAFQQVVIQNQQELWGRPYSMELHRVLRLKYSRWKTSRG